MQVQNKQPNVIKNFEEKKWDGTICPTHGKLY